MKDKLEELEARVTQLVDRHAELQSALKVAKAENEGLKTELAALRQEFDTYQLLSNDRAELVKTKLGSVLGRIEELESMAL